MPLSWILNGFELLLDRLLWQRIPRPGMCRLLTIKHAPREFQEVGRAKAIRWSQTCLLCNVIESLPERQGLVLNTRSHCRIGWSIRRWLWTVSNHHVEASRRCRERWRLNALDISYDTFEDVSVRDVETDNLDAQAQSWGEDPDLGLALDARPRRTSEEGSHKISSRELSGRVWILLIGSWAKMLTSLRTNTMRVTHWKCSIRASIRRSVEICPNSILLWCWRW